MLKPTDKVADAIEKYPDLNNFLNKKGLRCILCGEPVWGTLAEMIQSKGMNVDAIMKEINERFCD
jgi:hypothetical protein